MSKSLESLIKEMQQPLSQGDKLFKDAHNPVDRKSLVPGVTDQEHVFNGDTSPVENNFPNSHKPGEDIKAYEPEGVVKTDVKNNGYGTKIGLKKESSDMHAGQPTGIEIHMKHKETGKITKTQFPGTHSAIQGAQQHIKSMQKKGYELHAKKLMGVNEEIENLDTLDESRFAKGQDVGKPGKNFAKIASSAAARYGSKKAGQRVAGAVLKKVLAKEQATVDQSKDMQAPGSEQKLAAPGQFASTIKRSLGKSSSLRQRAARVRAVHTEETLNEKMTPEAKKNIQTALGHKDSSLRKTSSSAKAMISIAKMNKKNFVAKEEVNVIDEDYKADLPMMVKDLKSKKKSHFDMRREYGSSWKKLCNHCSDTHGSSYTTQHLVSMAQQHMKEHVELDEKITAKTPTGKVISDFVHSDNPKFAGKSTKERIHMALGASYAMKKEENDLAEGTYDNEPNETTHKKFWMPGRGYSWVKKQDKDDNKKEVKKEEAGQIDEISDKTLQSYKGKAEKSLKQSIVKKDDKSAHTVSKRLYGLSHPKLSKEEVELDEAKRGRPRKNPEANSGEDEGGREHIVVQLRKAENLRGSDKHIEFNDSSKHKLEPHHVKKALDMHSGMKPIQKGEFEKRLAASHSSFMSAIKGEPAPKAKPKISLGSMKKEAVERVADYEMQAVNEPNGKLTFRKVKKQMKMEAKDMTPSNVKKMVKHDCATHVLHKEWGEGRCVPEMHTIVETADGEGYVSHYDVMFEHGIVQNVPVEDLKILESMMHGHSAKKSVKEASNNKALAALAEPKNKVTKKDVLVGRGVLSKDGKVIKKEGWAKFSGRQLDEAEEMTAATVSSKAASQKVSQTKGDAGMQKDSLAKIKQDPQACQEALEALYDSLNEENKAKFDALLETEEGVDFLLQFAEQRGLI